MARPADWAPRIVVIRSMVCRSDEARFWLTSMESSTSRPKLPHQKTEAKEALWCPARHQAGVARPPPPRLRGSRNELLPLPKAA